MNVFYCLLLTPRVLPPRFLPNIKIKRLKSVAVIPVLSVRATVSTKLCPPKLARKFVRSSSSFAVILFRKLLMKLLSIFSNYRLCFRKSKVRLVRKALRKCKE